MSDEPKLNPFGYVNTPPLTKDQKDILLACFTEGMTISDAHKKAACSYDRARGFQRQLKTAQAIKDTQTSTVMVREIKALVEINTKLANAVNDLESRLAALETQTRKMRYSVAYQKIGHTEKRKEARAWKESWRDLAKLIHRKTGLTVSEPSPEQWKAKPKPEGA